MSSRLEYIDDALEYYRDLKYDKVYQLMSELHKKVNNLKPESHNEILFYQKYGYKIQEAWNYLTNYWTVKAPLPVNDFSTMAIRFENNSNVMAMHEAADIYTGLASEMSKEMDDLSTVAFSNTRS